MRLPTPGHPHLHPPFGLSRGRGRHFDKLSANGVGRLVRETCASQPAGIRIPLRSAFESSKLRPDHYDPTSPLRIA